MTIKADYPVSIVDRMNFSHMHRRFELSTNAWVTINRCMIEKSKCRDVQWISGKSLKSGRVVQHRS